MGDPVLKFFAMNEISKIYKILIVDNSQIRALISLTKAAVWIKAHFLVFLFIVRTSLQEFGKNMNMYNVVYYKEVNKQKRYKNY